MKKVLIIFAAIALSVACKKKEEKPLTMAEKLNGTWNVTKLDYSATVTIPGVPIGLPISGSSPNVGNMQFNAATGIATYDIEFQPNVNIPGVPPLGTVPIKGSGPYTATETSVKVTDTQSNTTFDFKVNTNEEKRQVWETTAPFAIDPNLPPVNVKLVIDMSKP